LRDQTQMETRLWT